MFITFYLPKSPGFRMDGDTTAVFQLCFKKIRMRGREINLAIHETFTMKNISFQIISGPRCLP